MRIIWQCGQEKIGKSKSRQVVLYIKLRRKYETRRIYPPRLRLRAQIADNLGIGAKQPKQASFDPVQNPHPDIEHGRVEFPAVVEAAKHKTEIRPGRRA